MSYHIIFNLLLVGSCAFALWAGPRDSRWIAVICLGATVASRLFIRPTVARYSGVEPGILIVDTATLAAFVGVALQSSRFWPMWIAGLQLTTLNAHLFKGLTGDLVPVVYASAARAWSYPILIILIVGTWRSYRRDRRDSQVEAIPR